VNEAQLQIAKPLNKLQKTQTLHYFTLLQTQLTEIAHNGINE